MNDRYTSLRDTRFGAQATPVIDVASHRVLRNTYTLLALTLAFSAICAGVSASLGLPHPGILITMVGYFGLLFAVTKFRNSGLGVALVFALTGFMGYTLGPIISHYLAMPNGTQIVMMAMGGTAAIFLALSGYVLVSKRDFSF
ncbi:MAG TPA: Bax inhibitor-1 family protein, partial [Noviherbaspirillum sp.]